MADLTNRVSPQEMAERPQQIRFNALLLRQDDSPAEGEMLAIQYYDTAFQGWIDLLRKVPLQGDGNLKITYVYANQGEPVDEIAGYLLNIIYAGGFPKMRILRDSTVNLDWPEVYAVDGLVSQNQEAPGDFEHNFGALWILEGHKINRTPTVEHPFYQYVQVAVPRPELTNTLYPAFAAAVQNIDTLQEYVAGETEVVIQAAGTGGSTVGGSTTEEQYTYFSNQLAIQQTQIDSLTASLQAKELEATQLYQDLTASQSEVESLQQVLQAEGSSAPISSVYEQMVTELDSASATLATRESATGQFKLGNVSINLKTLVSLDTEGKYQVQMLDASKATKVNTAAISDMKISILSKGDAATPANPNTVPQLVGFTETAVRQRLIPLGLKLVPIYQATENHPYGQAFQQKPAQGAALPDNRKVTVIFAKESSQFN